LSLNPRSPHFDEAVLSQGVGIRFNGVEKTNVVEYCVSEGWICVPAGRSLDRFGQPMQVKLKGVVEPYYEGEAAAADASRKQAKKKAPARTPRPDISLAA
jgi:hypothetical protein